MSQFCQQILCKRANTCLCMCIYITINYKQQQCYTTIIIMVTVPGSGQNWMEVAYGTSAGTVRVVVRHPENIGQAPQIFQSYSVHTCPIMRVVLGERHLISGNAP